MGGVLSRLRAGGSAHRLRRAPFRQNIAFHEVGRQAIMADPTGMAANINCTAPQPSKGLAVARMAAHITYVSEMALQRKFGRNLQNREALSFQFTPDFQIEILSPSSGCDFCPTALTPIPISTSPAPWIISTWRRKSGGQLSDVFRLNSARFCIISSPPTGSFQQEGVMPLSL